MVRLYVASALSAGANMVKINETTAAVERLVYTPAEASQALGVCRETLYRLIRAGRLRKIQGIRTSLIPRTELNRFLAESTGVLR